MSFQGLNPCVCAKISGIATGQTLQLARMECMAKGCFNVKKMILDRDNHFFAPVLLEMDLGDVETREA